MIRNEGRIDRAVRILLGFALLAASLAGPTWLALVAIVPLTTGIVGHCPLYRLFNMRTCSS